MTCNSQTDSKHNGRWTKAEHEKFKLGIQLYGKDWKQIQALIGTRNGAQIRSHAQKFYLKNKKETELENNDIWEQTKESASDLLQTSIAQSMVEPETNPDFSYYLNKIVQRNAFKASFDFWESLIDHKPIQETDILEMPQRKCSFVSIGGDKEDREGLEPAKNVKTE